MSTSNFIRNKIIYSSFLTTMFLLFLTTLTVAQENQQNGLVNPETFEELLPAELSPSWEKSNFSSRTSASEHWGGATYMGDGGAYMQIGVCHFSPNKWDKEKTKAKKNDDEINVRDYTGYLGETMGQSELIIYFDNYFSVRVVGPDLSTEELTATIKQLPIDKISTLKSDNSPKLNSIESESLDSSLFPDTLADMVHGRIRKDPEQPVMAVTYGSDDISYSVNVQIAAGGPMEEAKSALKEELNEANTDLKEIMYKGKKMWFREEESAISYTSFSNEFIMIISADAPVNRTFNKKEARGHLLNAIDELYAAI